MRVQNKPAHINCPKEDIAPIVLMPGDPLRAKYIAEEFLADYITTDAKTTDGVLVTQVRNMFGYTGFYKGKRVTVMASGMGMPSMGIYAYELYHFYDVETILRIGTCGNPLDPNTKLLDIAIADSSYSDANFAYQLYGEETHYVECDQELSNKLVKKAEEKNLNFVKGTIMTTEVFDFYIQDMDRFKKELPKEYNIVACEMEAYALFHVAKLLNKKAGCIATVVDSHFVDDFISIEDREKSLNEMIELALDSII